jgi:integrase
MSVREHPTKGRGWWTIDVGRGRNRKRPAFEGTYEEAQDWEMEIRAQTSTIQDKINPKFNQCIPEFLISYGNNRPASLSRTRISLDHLKKHFGNLSLLSITSSQVEQYKASRILKGVKPTTIQKELCALSSFLKWAKRERKIAHLPEFDKFPGKMVKAPLPVVPTQELIEQVIAEVRPEWKQIVFKLMLFCGLRRAEVLKLRGEDVLLDRGLLIVTGKGSKQRVVPVIRDDIKEGLRRVVEKAGAGYLWVNPVTDKPYIDIMDSLKEAARRLGFSGRWYNHILRHGFGTYSHEAGLSLRDIQVLMGHSTSQVTEIYTHTSSGHLAEALGRWQKK